MWTSLGENLVRYGTKDGEYGWADGQQTPDTNGEG
jgi:hypothetical protein